MGRSSTARTSKLSKMAVQDSQLEICHAHLNQDHNLNRRVVYVINESLEQKRSHYTKNEPS